jgi:hypothetical protein
LYSNGDHADEIYFIKKGRLKLFIDVNEENNEENEVPIPLAFNAYPEGSYFGDSDIDILGGTNERDSTAIVENDCHLLVL